MTEVAAVPKDSYPVRWGPMAVMAFPSTSTCPIPRLGMVVRCLDWLAGDEDGEDQADQSDDQHHGEGHGEWLALGEFDGDQGRADQGGAE